MTGTIKGAAHVAGAHEHPGRHLPDLTTPQIHAEVALGALADAGLTLADVDAYFCAGDAPGFGPMSMAEYLGLDSLSYVDSTEIGGSSYVAHVGHAAAAIAAGKCHVALITLAGKPRTGGNRPGGSGRVGRGLCCVERAFRFGAQFVTNLFGDRRLVGQCLCRILVSNGRLVNTVRL